MVFSKLNWILSLNLLRSTMLDLKYSKDTFSFESSSWRIHVSLQKAEGLCFMFDVPQSVTCHVMAVGHQGSNIPSPTSSSSLFGFHDHCWNLLTWQGPFSIPVSSRGTFTWRAFQTQDKPINELTSFFSKEGNPKINHPRIIIESSLNHHWIIHNPYLSSEIHLLDDLLIPSHQVAEPVHPSTSMPSLRPERSIKTGPMRCCFSQVM